MRNKLKDTNVENSRIFRYAKAAKQFVVVVVVVVDDEDHKKCNIGIGFIAVAFDLVTGVDFVVTVVYFLAIHPNIFSFHRVW